MSIPPIPANLVWLVIGGAAALTLETMARAGHAWSHWWPLYVPLSLGVSYGVYKLLTASGSGWLPTIALWSLTVGVGRIALAFAVRREPVSLANVVAACALLTATLVNAFWKK